MQFLLSISSEIVMIHRITDGIASDFTEILMGFLFDSVKLLRFFEISVPML